MGIIMPIIKFSIEIVLILAISFSAATLTSGRGNRIYFDKDYFTNEFSMEKCEIISFVPFIEIFDLQEPEN